MSSQTLETANKMMASMQMDAESMLAEAKRQLAKNTRESRRIAALAAENAAQVMKNLYNLEGRIAHALAEAA